MKKPKCFTETEYAEWTYQNNELAGTKEWADSPCEDCLTTFAAWQRRRGLCDGSPGFRLRDWADKRREMQRRAGS